MDKLEKQDVLDLIQDVLSEYLPKTRSSERKEIALVLVDELKGLGVDIVDDDSGSEETDGLEELDF